MTLPRLSQEIVDEANKELDVPLVNCDIAIEMMKMLPPLSQACQLGETFLEFGKFLSVPPLLLLCLKLTTTVDGTRYPENTYSMTSFLSSITRQSKHFASRDLRPNSLYAGMSRAMSPRCI